MRPSSPLPPSPAGDPAASLRDDYRARRAAVFERLRVPGVVRNVHATLRQLAGLADHALRALWGEAGLGGEAALVAVGGYGRGELFPHSDVDVLVLLPDGSGDPNGSGGAGRAARIEAFIGRCWDAGLEIGSSVRTVAECLEVAAADLTVQTALLESRLVAGDRRLFARLRERFAAALDAQAFFAAKSQEMRHRHHKFDDTPYALEPNCKESPGGLRDLQTVLWMTKAAGFGRCWDDLATQRPGHRLRGPAAQAQRGAVSQMRARLHVIAGRREDRLCSTCRPPWPPPSATTANRSSSARPAIS